MGNKASALDRAAIEAGIGRVETGVSVDEANKLWRLFDTDGSGFLETEEVTSLAETLVRSKAAAYKAKIENIQALLQDKESVNALHAYLDVSGDGRVSKSEFLVRVMEGGRIPLPRLEAQGLEIGLRQLLSGNGEFSVAEAEQVWSKYDTNGDGALDQQEAKKLARDLIDGACAGFKMKVSSLEAMLTDSGLSQQLLHSFDLGGDGRISKAEFMVKVVEGHEIEERPAKKRRTGGEWSADHVFQVSDTQVEAARSTKGVRVISASTTDNIQAAAESLNMGILVCPEGFCVVYSREHSAHFVLYMPSVRKSALAAFGTPHGEPAGPWSMENVFLLCKEEQATVSEIAGKAEILDSVESVTMAVEGLQRGLLKCVEDICVVFSASKKEYYVLYRGGRKEEAMNRFGRL